MSDAMITRRGGGGGGRLQSKTVTPAATASIVTPDSGYDGLSSVTVAAITPQKEATSYTPGTADQTIAANQWLAGAQTILGDANLLAANIKNGVSIFGITGTYSAASLDTNSAILEVVTSTGCSVSITNGTNTFTQQDADGFVRTGDANVTEHFFVIPTAAFGTFSVTSTHPTYGGNTKTNAVVIGNAGKIYEVLCGGKNIILNSTFGLQDGYSLQYGYASYDAINKEIAMMAEAQYNTLLLSNIPVRAYSELTLTAKGWGASGSGHEGYIFLRQDGVGEIANAGPFTASESGTTVNITGAYYETANLLIDSIRTITEIILT